MDHRGPEEFNELLKGYLRESLNPQELDQFFELAKKPENSQILAHSFGSDLENGLVDLTSDKQREDAWSRVQAEMKNTGRPVLQIGVALRWVAVFVCLIGAGVAGYIFYQSKVRSELAGTKPEIKTPAWLTSEHMGATLILTGGDSIPLDNRDRGIIANESAIQVIQSGGAISYSGKGNASDYNEIHTAKGKLWRAVLPDQTIVWLNGGSSIKFPLSFGADSRSVEMTGEIYFEVAHHADYPFQIKTGGLQIEDIGTSFNIKSSIANSISTATVVEGSVLVSFNNKQAKLISGQQSVINGKKTDIEIVKNANLTEALAWKNGFFYFRDAGLTDVMKQIADWYQVSVVYKGSPGKELFNGQIDKTLSLSDVLQGLQQPGVKFKLDSNHQQITVIRP